MINKVKFIGILGSGLFGAIILIVAPLMFGLAVMLLWNSVITPHGIMAISYLEAVGIYILTGLLFRKGNSRLSEFFTGGFKDNNEATPRKHYGPLREAENYNKMGPTQ